MRVLNHSHHTNQVWLKPYINCKSRNYVNIKPHGRVWYVLALEFFFGWGVGGVVEEEGRQKVLWHDGGGWIWSSWSMCEVYALERAAALLLYIFMINWKIYIEYIFFWGWNVEWISWYQIILIFHTFFQP